MNHTTDQEVIMPSITLTIQKELTEEFFGDILVTAFDGSYGSSWNWFEPVSAKNVDDPHWLKTKHTSGHTSFDNPWMSAHVRLAPDYSTGNPVFDSKEGFMIDHAALADGISRIINDDYVGTWRGCSESEAMDFYGGKRLTRTFRETKEKGLEIETGETARGYRTLLIQAVTDEESGDIDSDVADAIVQVAAFGKCIFG